MSLALGEQAPDFALMGVDGREHTLDEYGDASVLVVIQSCNHCPYVIAWEGRYLVVGFPAGIPRIPLNLPLLKSCDICGVFWGGYVLRDPQGNRRLVEHLLDLWQAGKISPRVTATYPLERAGEAIAALGAREAIGKLVVTID